MQNLCFEINTFINAYVERNMFGLACFVRKYIQNMYFHEDSPPDGFESGK